MTAARAAALPEPLTHGWGTGATVSLAAIEMRRLLLHPAYLAAFVYGAMVTGVDAVGGIGDFSREKVAEFIAVVFVFLLPMTAIFAASLVATSARRAGAEETLAALPVTARGRSAALLLAGLGPSAVSAVAAAMVWYLQRDLLQPSMYLSGGTLAAVPLLYLGVTALAVAAARWLPWPGAALVLLIGLVGWVGNTHGSPNAALVLTGPWIIDPDADKAAVIAGYSDVWHFVYLAGLVGLAATAALFRGDIHRLIMVGSAFGLVTVFAAWAQLP
jgi:hypothetical protein